jgi:hypothetical protein
MEQPKSILILQRVLVKYTLTKDEFKTNWAKQYSEEHQERLWERLVNGDPSPAPFLPHPCIADHGLEVAYARHGGGRERVLELAETSNTALDADDHPELHEEVEEQLNDLVDTLISDIPEMTFVVRTRGEEHSVLVCPDGTEVEMKTHSGGDTTDWSVPLVEVGQWKDIEVFYYGGTEQKTFVQNRNSGEELENVEVEVE